MHKKLCPSAFKKKSILSLGGCECNVSVLFELSFDSNLPMLLAIRNQLLNLWDQENIYHIAARHSNGQTGMLKFIQNLIFVKELCTLEGL